MRLPAWQNLRNIEINKELSVENVVVRIIIGCRRSRNTSGRSAKQGLLCVGKKVKENVRKESMVKTDNYTSDTRIKDHVWCHFPRKVKPDQTGKIFPWVHTMIANAKRTMLGVHHMVYKKYTQNFLDEFCYKVNRRYFGGQLFDRWLVACVTSSYKEIVIQNRSLYKILNKK
jgi:hypothetical protein